MNPYNRDRLISRAKSHIKQTGIACGLKSMARIEFLDEAKDWPDTFYYTLASQITFKGDYVKEVIKTDDGIEILVTRNPNFEINESIKRLNNVQKSSLILSAAISVVALILAFLSYNKPEVTKVFLVPQIQVKDTLPLKTEMTDKLSNDSTTNTDAKKN